MVGLVLFMLFLHTTILIACFEFSLPIPASLVSRDPHPCGNSAENQLPFSQLCYLQLSSPSPSLLFPFTSPYITPYFSSHLLSFFILILTGEFPPYYQTTLTPNRTLCFSFEFVNRRSSFSLLFVL